MRKLSYLSRHNFLIDLDGLIGEEWRIASCHFINKHTQCPPVHSFVVALQEPSRTLTHNISMDGQQQSAEFHKCLAVLLVIHICVGKTIDAISNYIRYQGAMIWATVKLYKAVQHVINWRRLTLLRMISGARYSGVPHNVQVLPFTLFAKPKSVTWRQISFSRIY